MFDSVVERLEREGKLKWKIDATYWKDYLHSLQYWTGTSWSDPPGKGNL